MEIRILHVGLSCNPGGIENYLLKLWMHINHRKYQFFFIDMYDGQACFHNELEQAGCSFCNITHRRKSFLQNYIDWKKVFLTEDIDIVHCHLNTLSDITPVILGLRYKKKVIVHSRSSKMTKSLFTALMHRFHFLLLPRRKISMVAVSQKAGEWLFGKKANFQVINNGVDIQKFQYQDGKRLQLRTAYELNNCFVIGHVGAFLPVKNHSFVIDVFNEVYTKQSDARLVLIGDGPARDSIEKKVAEKGLADFVLFLGKRKDVASWYSAMDAFVFPSFFEGFPNVILEAQATGLPCIMSDNITDEVVRFPICKKMSLGVEAKEWAKQILKNSVVVSRAVYADQIAQQGYDTAHEMIKIEQLYDNCMSIHKS